MGARLADFSCVSGCNQAQGLVVIFGCFYGGNVLVFGARVLGLGKRLADFRYVVGCD